MTVNPFKAEPTGVRLALNRLGLRVRNLERRFIQGVGTTVGVAAESLVMDSGAAAGATSTTVLETGQKYLLTVQGTYSLWNTTLEVGTPEADAMFPTSVSRVSTEVGLDAECEFAGHDTGSGVTLGHQGGLFQIDLGSGFAHIEPDDGQHTTPAPGHQYSYTVVGQGSPVSFKISDVNYTDNYGEFKIIIQALDPSSGGGGGGTGTGTLVPPPGDEGAFLRVESGIAAWHDSVTEADLSLSDVTTGDVSTSEHGFAPKAPGGTTEFLRADGTWATPSGGSGSLPDPSGEPDGAWLKTSDGAAIWVATPAVAESDLNLSDVTTANASTSKHGLLPKLDGSTVHFFRGDGSWAAPPAASGHILDSAQYTGGALNITATTDATAQTVCTGAGATFDGSTSIIVIFYAVAVDTPAVSGANIVLVLYDGATDLGRIGLTRAPTAATYRWGLTATSGVITPTAGTHTYSIKAFVTPSGLGVVYGSTGGAGNNMPSTMLVTQVA